jgi:hypothetical protein
MLPDCAIIFVEEATFAVVSLSGVKPLIWDEA